LNSTTNRIDELGSQDRSCRPNPIYALLTFLPHWHPSSPLLSLWPLLNLLQCCIVLICYMAFMDNCGVEFYFSCRDCASMLYVSTCILLPSSCEPSLQISSRIILSYHGRRCILLPLFFPLVLFTCFVFFSNVSEGLYCIIAVL
jgi:hypothetical protein